MLNVKDLDKEVVLRLNSRDFIKLTFETHLVSEIEFST